MSQICIMVRILINIISFPLRVLKSSFIYSWLVIWVSGLWWAMVFFYLLKNRSQGCEAATLCWIDREFIMERSHVWCWISCYWLTNVLGWAVLKKVGRAYHLKSDFENEKPKHQETRVKHEVYDGRSLDWISCSRFKWFRRSLHVYLVKVMYSKIVNTSLVMYLWTFFILNKWSFHLGSRFPRCTCANTELGYQLVFCFFFSIVTYVICYLHCS